MNANACYGCAEQHPFQQDVATLGFSGPGPDIVRAYGRALFNFLGIATLFAGPEVSALKAQAMSPPISLAVRGSPSNLRLNQPTRPSRLPAN